MGGLLDATALLLAVVVATSLVLLAWTIGISAVMAARRGRRRIDAARADVARAERGLREAGLSTRELLGELIARSRLDRRKGQ